MGAYVDFLSSWGLPLVAVGGLGVLTLVVGLLVGRWIDAQSNSVVEAPRKPRRERGSKE